jgi:hypothetical protein
VVEAWEPTKLPRNSLPMSKASNRTPSQANNLLALNLQLMTATLLLLSF